MICAGKPSRSDCRFPLQRPSHGKRLPAIDDSLVQHLAEYQIHSDSECNEMGCDRQTWCRYIAWLLTAGLLIACDPAAKPLNITFWLAGRF